MYDEISEQEWTWLHVDNDRSVCNPGLHSTTSKLWYYEVNKVPKTCHQAANRWSWITGMQPIYIQMFCSCQPHNNSITSTACLGHSTGQNWWERYMIHRATSHWLCELLQKVWTANVQKWFGWLDFQHIIQIYTYIYNIQEICTLPCKFTLCLLYRLIQGFCTSKSMKRCSGTSH